MTIKDSFIHTLAAAVVQNASDVHIESDSTIWFRLHGELTVIGGLKMDPGAVVDWMTQEAKDSGNAGRSRALANLEVSNIADLALEINLPELGSRRLRVHIKRVRGRLALSYRIIAASIPSMDMLGTPEAFRALFKSPNGLILVCGQTGSGKSTTLAAAAQEQLNTERIKLVTYESPVEAILHKRLGLVEQHEVGPDADISDFRAALKSSMREDPEIIMVGEMRDSETILDGFKAADTGHLIVSTLHTGTAVDSTSRLMDAPPAETQPFYRAMLAGLLRGVLCQKLIPRGDGAHGRVAAYELMIVNDTIRAQIAEGRKNQIYDSIIQGRKEGMITFARSLAELVGSGIVKEDVAVTYLSDRRQFDTDLINYRKNNPPASPSGTNPGGSRPVSPLAPRPPITQK